MLYILPPLDAQQLRKWESQCATAEETECRGGKRPPRISRALRDLNKDEFTCSSKDDEGIDSNRNPKSLSECYFASKGGTALVLPDAEAAQKSGSGGGGGGCVELSGTGGNGRRSGGCGYGNSNIQKHLQLMFYLLRPEETLKMAVKLESVHPSRTRYLVVVSRMGSRGEESCLLGIDCNEQTTVGLVLRVLANTSITLDGDGGFSVSVCDRHHIFKPVSVQAMWSALQTLHKVSAKAREHNYFQGGSTHEWVSYYESKIASDRSCLNEWHAMDNLESKRPPSPDSVRHKPTERQETEQVIRATLKEIMMSVDLDEVTSKFIRGRLEEELDMDLGEYKSFIDQEMLVILGQMDAPTEIFEHVYLGSEWNASNYEELQRNGVGHILNVTREIDNFFPGAFDYLNVRVYDDEKTDLLKHWDDTYKYITKAKDKGSKVLVHCKMGVSRSASVVIAYAMKAYNWDFDKALHHVKEKRTCIKPNTSFLNQLETYQGILDAMKNKEKLQRSKSETNLKSGKEGGEKAGPEPVPAKQDKKEQEEGTEEVRVLGVRPKSWSPENAKTEEVSNSKSPGFLSLEDLSPKVLLEESRHVLMPCDNGESYSVSPNQIVHLPGNGAERREDRRRVSKSLVWDPGDDKSEEKGKESQKVQDVFSNQVDRVFDKEEKRSKRLSGGLDVAEDALVRECPSRQSSWSSYDSALGFPEQVLSRHSSWGSGDTRTLPSRNSSWGSYDMRPKSVVYTNEKGEKVKCGEWSGTVKRKEKEGKSASTETLQNSAISKKIDIPFEEAKDRRLCISAPEKTSVMELEMGKGVILEPQCASVREHRNFLEAMSQDKGVSGGRRMNEVQAVGKVKNLKKEFEAKSLEEEKEKEKGKKGGSLPTSPVGIQKKEEKSFKTLIEVFEGGEVKVRPRSLVNGWKGERRPPLKPGGRNEARLIAATVIATATKKQQQYGKSHPLARLSIKPRHNSPLYNTM